VRKGGGTDDHPTHFPEFSSAGALTLYTLNEFGVEEAIAAIPGGTSCRRDPSSSPAREPPAMPHGLNQYSIAVRQFNQQILRLPAATTVWLRSTTNRHL